MENLSQGHNITKIQTKEHTSPPTIGYSSNVLRNVLSCWQLVLYLYTYTYTT